MAFFTVLQLCNDPLCFPFGSPLSGKASAKGSDHTNKILDQVFFSILSQIEHLALAALPRQQLLDVVETETGQAVFMLYHNQSNRWFGQQLEQFGAGVVHPRTALFYHRTNPVAFRSAVIGQPFRLPSRLSLFSAAETRV